MPANGGRGGEGRGRGGQWEGRVGIWEKKRLWGFKEVLKIKQPNTISRKFGDFDSNIATIKDI